MEQQQEKSLERKYAFSSVPMYEHKTPEFIENNGEEYIIYGQNNEYGDYLTYLYNRCGLHHAIVNGKVRFILGQGWKIKEGFESQQLQRLINNPNPNDSLDELSKKVLLDRKIFGGNYYKVMFVGGQLVSMFHQPYEQVRLSVDGSVFYVSKEWTRNQTTKKNFKSRYNTLPKDVKMIKPFDPNNKEGVQLVYFYDSRPEFRGYPLPEYHATIVDIETDIEISNFNLNNVKSGWSAGKMVTFFNGVPSPEEQSTIERDLKNKASGSDNAGEILIQFADINATPPKVDNLQAEDISAQHEGLKQDVQDRIIRGHEVVNGMLFGIKTEGQLGGRSELDLAWRMLDINYIEPNQLQIQSELNWVLKMCGLPPALRIEPLKGLGLDISESMLMAALTRDELRKLIEDTLNIGLDLTTQTGVTELSKKNLDANMDAIVLSKFATIGLSREQFEFASDEDALLKYIIDNNIKKLDINKATKELDIDVPKALQKLIEKNLLGGLQGGTESAPKYDIKEVVEPETLIEFETKWEYAGPKDDKNRSFCAKMLSLNKLYTKDEIDSLNNDMKEYNTDVWKYKGGWYHDTKLDQNFPQCRHWFAQRIVRKK